MVNRFIASVPLFMVIVLSSQNALSQDINLQFSFDHIDSSYEFICDIKDDSIEILDFCPCSIRRPESATCCLGIDCASQGESGLILATFKPKGCLYSDVLVLKAGKKKKPKTFNLYFDYRRCYNSKRKTQEIRISFLDYLPETEKDLESAIRTENSRLILLDNRNYNWRNAHELIEYYADWQYIIVTGANDLDFDSKDQLRHSGAAVYHFDNFNIGSIVPIPNKAQPDKVHSIAFNFDAGKSKLLPEHKEIIKSNLDDFQDKELLINGSADATGERNSNLVLAKNRAQVLYNFLVELGIPSSNMTLEWDESTREGRAFRSTEISIVEQNQMDFSPTPWPLNKDAQLLKRFQNKILDLALSEKVLQAAKGFDDFKVTYKQKDYRKAEVRFDELIKLPYSFNKSRAHLVKGYVLKSALGRYEEQLEIARLMLIEGIKLDEIIEIDCEVQLEEEDIVELRKVKSAVKSVGSNSSYIDELSRLTVADQKMRQPGAVVNDEELNYDFLKLVSKTGWPDPNRVGYELYFDSFIVALHALSDGKSDVEEMTKFLPLLQKEIVRGNLSPDWYTILADRFLELTFGSEAVLFGHVYNPEGNMDFFNANRIKVGYFKMIEIN